MQNIENKDMKNRIMEIIKWYYWATVIFVVLDLAFSINIRTAAFGGNAIYKFYYYAFCFICLAVIMLKPKLAFIVGLLESTISIVLLILGFLVPLYLVPGQIESGVDLASVVTTNKIINFLISATIESFAFYGAIYGFKR
jgi:hypothetical protein